MNNPTRILVPYDTTNHNEQAFGKSLEIAKKNNSKIFILACLKEKFSFGFFKSKSDKKNFQEKKTKASEKIKKWTNLAKKNHIPINSKIITCNTASKEIIDFSKSNKINLIAMSQPKNETQIDKIYAESTIKQVFEKAPCSFLVIR